MAYTAPQGMGPLVQPADLGGFRGAPFEETVVTAAGESIRSECGWHIAPALEQTTRIRTGRLDTVNLPSLHVVDVVSVLDRDGAPVTGWDWWEHGVLDRPGGFPETITVTFRHGYEACPKDLYGIIAERSGSQATGRIKAEALMGRSVQLDGGYDPNTPAILAGYRLNPGS